MRRGPSHHVRAISPIKGPVAGKVALVTGAGSGIGRATAAAISADGGAAWSCRLDVTAEPTWQQTIDQLLRARGRLDIAVNCAGISFACPVADMRLEDWRRVMVVNVEGVFLGTKHAIRVMRQSGRGGSIVNVSSVSGIKAQPEASAPVAGCRLDAPGLTRPPKTGQ